MALLSQQLRDLVRQTSTSAYAIAKEAGIEQSAMSRYMNGGRLTMAKLDQLAAVLGVYVTSQQVSTFPRPLEKGRPRKHVKGNEKMHKNRAQFLANLYAGEAFRNHFSSRRGVWHTEHIDCLLVFNNNPFEVDESVRPREMKRLEKRLKAAGIKTLARGVGGDKATPSYTATLLLDCSRDRMQEVIDIARQEAETAIAEIENICGLIRPDEGE